MGLKAANPTFKTIYFTETVPMVGLWGTEDTSSVVSLGTVTTDLLCVIEKANEMGAETASNNVGGPIGGVVALLVIAGIIAGVLLWRRQKKLRTVNVEMGDVAAPTSQGVNAFNTEEDVEKS